MSTWEAAALAQIVEPAQGLPLEIWRALLGYKGQNKAPPETVGASAHLNGEHGRSGVEAGAA